MDQVFRIEIPVEAVNKTDVASLQKLEGELDKLASKAEKAKAAMSGIKESAQQAGNQAKQGMNAAGQSADKFTQRIEKSQKTLRGMFKEKLKLIIEALDKASPVIKSLWTSLRGMAGKAWHVAVRMTDFITAPFRKLYNMITSPITLALSVAGIGMGAGDLVTTFKDFSTGMSAVKALTSASDVEFQKLTQTAKDLGASTVFSASETSMGMQYLAMSGWDTNQILAAMPGLLDLAAAGATDLAVASDIVANVMNAMGMAAEQAGHAADIFAKTATSSNTTIEYLGETLKYAAPIAHSFGLSLEEVSAVAGMMANAGIKGSMAGTAIRSSLLSMASPTAEAAKLMNSLGLSFSNADGSMKGMSEIVRNLQTAFSTLTEAQRLQYTETLFGTYASSAWLGIINQGADTYDAFAESLGNAGGAAKEMAQIRLDNLAGDIEELSGAVETAKIELMEKLAPYLRQAIKWLTEKIPTIQAVIEQTVDKAIVKIRALKEHMSGIFSSDAFKSANGFAAKMFVLWDQIIAQPFKEWWEGPGRERILGIVADIGRNIGQALHGIVASVFAALRGEEIDFEGLNLTGIGAAAASSAKKFAGEFAGALDLGGLMGAAPGGLKAGLFGIGALKLGQGMLGYYRLTSGLKTAFVGIKGVAATAGTATASVNAAVVATTASTGKAIGVLGGLKAVLAAIPVWGWVAAAAITAGAIGIKMYSDAQERQRQELLHMGDSVQEAAGNYKTAARKVVEARETFDKIKEIEIKIKRGGLTTQEITDLQAEIAMVQSRTVWLEAQLASGTLTTEQIEAYQAELNLLKGRSVELDAQLAEARVTKETIEAYASELGVLDSRTAWIDAQLASGHLTGEQAQAYMNELAIIKSREETITMNLEGLGMTAAGIWYARTITAALDGKTAEVKVLMAESSLTKDEIDNFTGSLADIYTRKAEIDIQLTGASMTAEQVKTYREDLAGIQDRTATIEAKMAAGGLSTGDIEKLSREYAELKAREATITLLLSGNGLSAEELGALVEEYEALQNREAVITAKMSAAGMSAQAITTVSEAMQAIGDITASLNVSFAVGSLSTDEIAAYNVQLETLYGKLVELSGGVITQEDVEAGRVTDERVAQAEAAMQATAKADLMNLETEVLKGRASLPEQEAARARYYGEYEAAQSTQDRLSTARATLAEIEAQRQQLLAKDTLNYTKAQTGEWSWDDYDKWYEFEVMPGMSELQSRYRTEVAPNATDKYGFPVLSPEAPDFLSMFEGGFIGWLETIAASEITAKSDAAAAKGVYDTQNASLVNQYGGEKALMEGKAFIGTSLQGMSLEEIALSYATLDDAGRKMFEDAVKALDALNQQTNYLTDAEKTQALDVAELAAKAEVLKQVKDQVATMAADYQAMSDEQKATFDASEQGAKALRDVNDALAALGIDKISSLNDLTAAIESLEAVDLSTFTLTKAQEAFVTLGGNAAGAKTSVDALMQSLRAIDGKTASTMVTHTTRYITETELPGNANGGIYDGAMLSWVAEDGPEAIIPLGGKRRKRGLELWLAAGSMLGVSEFAEGGIAAPYAGLLGSLPEETWGDGEGGLKPLTGRNGYSFSINVEASPSFQIEGGNSSEDILEKLKAKQAELAEIFGGAIAEQLEDIVSNMA